MSFASKYISFIISLKKFNAQFTVKQNLKKFANNSNCYI